MFGIKKFVFDQLCQLSLTLENKHHWHSAAAVYQVLVVLNNQQAGWFYRLGWACEKSAGWEEAARAYQSAISLDGSKPQWFYRLGLVLEKCGHWKESAVAYQAAVERDDQQAGWFYRLGWACEKSAGWEEAARAYQSAISLDGSKPQWFYRLGLVLEKCDHWKESAVAYQAAVERDHQQAGWFYRLGWVHEKNGGWEEAARAYQSAINLDGSKPQWFYRLGSVLEKCGCWKESAVAYHAAVERDDRKADWFYRLGWVREKSAGWQEAARAYQAAVSLDDSNPQWFYRLGSVLEKCGCWKMAGDAFRKSKKLNAINTSQYSLRAKRNAEKRRTKLFDLLKLCLDNRAKHARVCDIDRFIENNTSAFVVKHDVHGVDPESLVGFAQLEADMKIKGSYYFMPTNHPHTIRHYSAKQQITAMKAIQEMGHELGLHIDPYFVLKWKKKPLRKIVEEILGEFNQHGFDIVSANIHGNSSFRFLDRNGHGASFELFEEISRQSDFPTLENIDAETAMTIRQQRIRIADFGLTHWADVPLFSGRYGFVVTNFISDNRFGKHGTIEILVKKGAIGNYMLCDRQPPGYYNSSPAREYIPTGDCSREVELPYGSHHLPFDDGRVKTAFIQLSVHPTQILIHPQHYC